MWLNPDNTDTGMLSDLLRPFPDDGIKFHPVSSMVNSPRNQEPSLIEKVYEVDSCNYYFPTVGVKQALG